MKFSKKSRYGITALIDLAIYSQNGRVALNSIAERNNISLQYLEQIFSALKKTGIVKSIKGAQGGYLLNKPSNEITMAMIVEALDGTYKIEDEQGNEKSAVVIQQEVIDKVNDAVENIINNITLADLLKAYEEQNDYSENMYYI